MIERRDFGDLPTGETVEAFTLSNGSGVSCEVITYGGIVTRLVVPDRDDRPADVVLGFDNLASYLAGHPFFGTITGRVAGRITRGNFELEGEVYDLAITDGPNHLHGGKVGLDKRLWTPEPVDDDATPTLRLRYMSPEGEEGYPGNLELQVSYALDGSALVITYEARTDRATPLCLTNHSYFDLAGEGSAAVEDHVLEIFSDTVIATDDDLTLLGRAETVDGRPNDFRSPRRVGDAIPGLWLEHGDSYRLRDRPAETPELAARLTHPVSGRTMEVLTTDTFLQFYTGKFLDGTLTGKSGRAYGPCAGLCLECHGYSDGVNRPDIDDIVLQPGETYRRQTAYDFSPGVGSHRADTLEGD